MLLAVVLAFPLRAQTPQHYSLETCKQLALDNNKRIKSAGFDIEASRAAHQSVVANTYPSITGSILAIYLGSPLGGAFNGMIPSNMAQGSITATQVIYAGGKINHGKVAAEKGIDIYQDQKALTESEVLLQVIKAYWQVVQVNEKTVLATRYKAMLQSLQSDLQNSYDAGLIYKNDLLRATVSLNEAELSLTQAQDALVLAKLNLAQLVGNPGQTNFTLNDSISGSFTPAVQLSQSSADQRPEIRMLQKSIQIEELQRKILQADRGPVLAASVSGVSAMGKRVNFEDGSSSMNTYYGMANLSFPIFEWGKHTSKIKEQTFKIEARKQQEANTRELIDLEIQQKYLQLFQVEKKVKLSTLSLTQAEENLKLTNDRFKAGTIVGKDVQEAQAIWQEAYSKLIDAKAEFKISEAEYQKAIGGTL